MAVQASEVQGQALWGRFEAVKEHLLHQYEDVAYDPETGLSLEALEAEVRAYLAAHPDQPRVLQKAHVMRLVLTKGQIAIDPEDWFVDKVNHGCMRRSLGCEGQSGRGGLVRRLSLDWLEEACQGEIAEGAAFFERARRLGQCTGPRGGLDRGHIAPGWDHLLAVGLSGLLDEVAAARQALGADATPEQLAFYEAVEIVYTAAIELGQRFSRLARRMMDAHPEHRQRLEIVAEAMANVPAHGPRTFHEALQFVWLMHELIEMEGEFVRSAGQFDRSLYPFFRADIDAGRLTRDQARELIQFFWWKWYSRTQGRENGKNFCFGGQAPDGSEITNELTFLALEAHEALATPDPKLSVRLGPTTPEALYRRVAELVRTGEHSFVLMNDPVAIEALVKRGKTPEDARYYLPIGCYEPAVEGKEAGCTMNITVNLAKGLELALNDGRDRATGEQIGPRTGDPRDFATFDDLWRAYTAQMDHFLEGALAGIQAAEGAWPRINPSPMVAGTFEHCIARGKDIGQGGPLYNSVGFVGAGLANAADALLALKQAVYDEGRYTMDEVLAALESDYVKQEPLRRYLLNRVPKWGNGDPAADAMGRRVADYYCETVHSFTNGRGGACQAALFTLSAALTMGKRTAALPDGRRAGESLAPGQGASYGRDKAGVTGLIDSIAALDGTATPNGAVVDITLHPSAVEGEAGLEALVALIKTFIARGGYACQFNVYDVDTLRAAQRHPERYASLQIRVTGWSVYWNTLSRLEQDQYIARVTHAL